MFWIFKVIHLDRNSIKKMKMFIWQSWQSMNTKFPTSFYVMSDAVLCMNIIAKFELRASYRGLCYNFATNAPMHPQKMI